MDALDRELSAALSVDPSPEFVARVRARIALAPPPARWLMPRVPRLLMAAGVALAVMVVAVAGVPPREQVFVPTVRLKADATNVGTNAPNVVTNAAAPQPDAVFAWPH